VSTLRGPIPHFRERLDVLLFNRGVVLLGWICAWVHCSIEAATREIEPLLHAGVLVRLTPDECRARGWRGDAVAFRAPSSARGETSDGPA
jgi:hypothetical protein